jgi:hypothetical protein
MELSTDQIKEIISMLSAFKWPVALLILAIIFKGVTEHLFIAFIDFVFRRKV